MNRIIYLGLVGVIVVLAGCTIGNNTNISNENSVVKNIQKNVDKKENIQNKQQNNLDKIKTKNITQDNVEDILGENVVDEGKNSDKENRNKKQNNIECKDGYVYNTELKECFKLGNSDNVADVKIDPIVKDCIDKGGIYNAQVEKCFVN